jgi:hypothetical protein
MFWKRDTIDEMDRTTVDEMDRSVIDDMSASDTSDYYDSSRYYDPSRYGTSNDASHDSHLCEDGHDHDEIDRRRSASYRPEKEKTPYGGHLCEDGEHHESRSAASDRRPNGTSYSGSSSTGSSSAGGKYTSVTDYSPKPGKVYADTRRYTGTGSDTQKNPGSLRAIGIIFLIIGFLSIESVGMVFLIIGVVMMKTAGAVKEENKHSGTASKSSGADRYISDTEDKMRSMMAAKAIIMLIAIAVIIITFIFIAGSFNGIMSELD